MEEEVNVKTTEEVVETTPEVAEEVMAEGTI
jgi:hypothetical protein